MGSQRLVLTVPAGWEAIDTVWVFKNAQAAGEHYDLAVFSHA